MAFNYWRECLECSLDTHAPGVLSTDQIRDVAKDLERGAAMHTESTGQLSITNPLTTELTFLKRVHAQEIARLEQRERIYQESIKARFRADVWVTISDGEVQVELAR